MCVQTELIHFKQWFILRWPTVGRVAFTVVRLTTHDCTGGLWTRCLTME